MKRLKSKGAKPFVSQPHSTQPHAGVPNTMEMHRLAKSPHSVSDYAKLSPMNMTAANMPVAQVGQFAQKGLK